MDTIQIEMKQLLKNLNSLEKKVAKKVLRKALREGSKIFLSAAKSNAPTDTGELKRSLKLRAIKKSRNWAGITVGTSKGDYQGDQYYGAFQEFGTSKIQAKHYLENSFNANKTQVLNKVCNALKQGIETEANNG